MLFASWLGLASGLCRELHEVLHEYPQADVVGEDLLPLVPIRGVVSHRGVQLGDQEPRLRLVLIADNVPGSKQAVSRSEQRDDRSRTQEARLLANLRGLRNGHLVVEGCDQIDHAGRGGTELPPHNITMSIQEKLSETAGPIKPNQTKQTKNSFRATGDERDH